MGQLNPDQATEALLHERFQDYGNIKNIHLVKRNKMGAGHTTAFAFIEFDSEQAARRAIDHEVNIMFEELCLALRATGWVFLDGACPDHADSFIFLLLTIIE